MHDKNRTLLYFLLCSSLIALNCKQGSQQADIILFNGKIITMDDDHTMSEAVAIKEGKFLAVGNNKEIKKVYAETAHQIDLKGLTMVPGIIEGHVHPMGASTSEHFEKIPDVHTIAELLRWIRSQVQIREKDDWIIHPKFFATRLIEMRQPTIAELDSVAPHHPVFLDGSYGGMVNSKAFQVSHITDSTEHPGIIRDPKSGNHTGIIRGSAFELLAIDRDEKLSQEDQMMDLKQLLKIYNSVGITSICVGNGSTRDLNAFKSLRDKGELTVRIFQNIRIPFDPKDSLGQMREALDRLEYRTGTGDHWVKVGALKATIDGGILTGTAYLREPWGAAGKEIYGITDSTYRGVLRIEKEALVRMIRAANETGWKFTSHVTGGGGVDILLSAIEEVARTQSVRDKRFSVIHGNFYTPEAIQKMKKLGVYADMQPAWFLKDADLLYKVLGEDRIKTFHPYRSLFDAGVMVNGGSDHMVKLDSYTAINPFNPFLSMWSVITRKTERGTIFTYQEALTRRQALEMYTINNAFASFEEDLKGSIEPGKLADLAILSDDFLTCSEEKIKEIEVVLTMVDGKIVFENGTLSLIM